MALNYYWILNVDYLLHSCLRKLVSIQEIKQATNQRAKNRGIELIRFQDVEKIGSSFNLPDVPPKSTDLSTICYTSGTTGSPKGVMLTHQNVMAGICSVLHQLGDYKPTSQDIMISFLPLAHMLERCCENGMFMVGGAVGYYSGDIKKLSDDMRLLKPTVMPAVPRLLNRLYYKVCKYFYNRFQGYSDHFNDSWMNFVLWWMYSPIEYSDFWNGKAKREKS